MKTVFSTNNKRADWALAASKIFADRTMPGWIDADLDYAINDLVCNLAHLIRRRGHDPMDVFARQLGVFLAEENDAWDEPCVNITVKG